MTIRELRRELKTYNQSREVTVLIFDGHAVTNQETARIIFHGPNYDEANCGECLAQALNHEQEAHERRPPAPRRPLKRVADGWWGWWMWWRRM